MFIGTKEFDVGVKLLPVGMSAVLPAILALDLRDFLNFVQAYSETLHSDTP